jgi:ABC-type multidrug transport system permease subunit
MPAQMLGRPIIRKQTDYGFYRPAAYQIANTLADMPFSATRILIYDIIIYFMTHLARTPGRFLTFHLVNYTAFLTMQGFFRTIGLFFSDYHTAYRMAMAIFPNLIMYIGYIVPINQMKRWLFWMVSFLLALGPSLLITSHHWQFYINPLNYGWSALMENEFQPLTVRTSPPPFSP